MNVRHVILLGATCVINTAVLFADQPYQDSSYADSPRMTSQDSQYRQVEQDQLSDRSYGYRRYDSDRNYDRKDRYYDNRSYDSDRYDHDRPYYRDNYRDRSYYRDDYQNGGCPYANYGYSQNRQISDNYGQNRNDSQDSSYQQGYSRDRHAFQSDRGYSQNERSDDLGIRERIRQAISRQDGLSNTSRDVQVTVEGGQVTLRGYVANDSDKSRIESIARQNGATTINNQLSIQGENKRY